MSMFNLYLLLVVLPNANVMFIILIVISSISLIVALVGYFVCLCISEKDFYPVEPGHVEDRKEKEKKSLERGKKQKQDILKIIKKIIIVLLCVEIISIPSVIILPSKNDVYVLTGAYIVSNAKNIDKLPSNLVNAANKYLENYGGEK